MKNLEYLNCCSLVEFIFITSFAGNTYSANLNEITYTFSAMKKSYFSYFIFYTLQTFIWYNFDVGENSNFAYVACYFSIFLYLFLRWLEIKVIPILFEANWLPPRPEEKPSLELSWKTTTPTLLKSHLNSLFSIFAVGNTFNSPGQFSDWMMRGTRSLLNSRRNRDGLLTLLHFRDEYLNL